MPRAGPNSTFDHWRRVGLSPGPSGIPAVRARPLLGIPSVSSRETWRPGRCAAETQRQEQSSHESPDMRPERHAAGLLCSVSERAETRDKLGEEPEADQPHGGDSGQRDRPEEDERANAGAAEND